MGWIFFGTLFYRPGYWEMGIQWMIEAHGGCKPARKYGLLARKNGDHRPMFREKTMVFQPPTNEMLGWYMLILVDIPINYSHV